MHLQRNPVNGLYWKSLIDEDYIRIAIITGVHGLTGRLKLHITTDVNERFETGKTVYIKKKDVFAEFQITGFSRSRETAGLLQIVGINDRNTAQEYIGAGVFIDKSEADKTKQELLNDDSFYYNDIIGCSVFYTGAQIGTVTDILDNGAGQILIISSGAGKEYMVPFVESMVDTSGIGDKKLSIHPVEGLIDI
jgi:16S rRNA processing protein RimM